METVTKCTGWAVKAPGDTHGPAVAVPTEAGFMSRRMKVVVLVGLMAVAGCDFTSRPSLPNDEAAPGRTYADAGTGGLTNQTGGTSDAGSAPRTEAGVPGEDGGVPGDGMAGAPTDATEDVGENSTDATPDGAPSQN